MKYPACLVLCVFALSIANAQQPVFNSAFGTLGEVQIDNGSCISYNSQNISGIRAMTYFSNGELLGAFTLGTANASIAQYGLAKFFSNGSLDSSFGINGVVTIAPAGSIISFRAAQVQSDGKILVAGTGDGLTDLIRLLPNGELDSSFNGTGILTFELLRSLFFSSLSESDYLSDVLIQKDGKYLVLGDLTITNPTGNSPWSVTRINPNGSLDSSFGTNGIAQIGAPNGANFQGMINPDGSITLMSSIQDKNDNNYTAQAYRLNANGVPDSSFGTNALITYNGLGPAFCHQLLGTSNGNYYMLANSQLNEYTDTGYFIVRFQPNGLIDSSFSTNGRFNSITWQGARMKFFNMDTLPDGSLVVLNGTDSSSLREGSYLINITTSGTLNTNFGTQGVDKLPDSPAHCVRTDPYTKRIYAYDAQERFGLSTFNLNGTPDISFGNNGAMTTNLRGGGVTGLEGLGITSDKKIITLGQCQGCAAPNDTTRFFLNRYLTNGSPDNTFGTRGSIRWTFLDGNVHPFTMDAMAVTIDNGIVFGGQCDSARAYIEKRRADGSVDSSFGTLGTWFSPWRYLFTHPHYFGALAVQPDGKIVYAATIDSIYSGATYGERTVIGRLTLQGQPDPDFGINGMLLLPWHSPFSNFNLGDAIALRPNGDILVTSSADSGIQVIQLTPNGTIDPGFGNQGIFKQSYTQQGITAAEDIKIKADSSIIILYSMFPSGPTSAVDGIRVLRLLPNGQLDSNFLGGPYYPGAPLLANQLQLQDDGRILIPAVALTSEPHFAVIRLRPDGRADNTFAPNGVVIIDNRDAIEPYTTNSISLIDVSTPVLMAPQDSTHFVLGGTIQDLSTKGYLTSFYAKDSVLPNDADTMSITLTDTLYSSPCQTIKLSWIARNDTTSHYFSVQRTSQYGGIYTPIAMILPAAHTHGALQYYYTDSVPLPNYNWYRVQLVMGGDSLLASNQVDRFSDTSSPGKIGKPAAGYTVNHGAYSTVVTWKISNQKTLDSITILRARDNGAFIQAGWQNPQPPGTNNAYSYPDPDDLQPGHTYTYKIELFGTNCVNAFSDTVDINLPAIDSTTGPGSGSGNGSGNTSPSNPTDTVNNIKVYPNPATSALTIAIPSVFDSGAIKIISFDGKILYNQQVTAPANGVLLLNIGWLDPGIYYLELINSQKVWVTTFLKT